VLLSAQEINPPPTAAEPAEQAKSAEQVEQTVQAEPVEPTVTATAAAATEAPARMRVAYVIPIKKEVAKPTLYILRRGLKEAIEQKADLVVLDMETPGGALDVTFEIMEALDKFPGGTVTFVNKEAISAGAFISAVTDEIYFAPGGVIGAAAPVLATGGEIDASMKQKIVSYLRARVRAVSEGKGYRGEVISAMIDADYELKIDDKVIKPKGELLSLTASEATKTYGDPPQPLLAAGIVPDLEALLAKKFGEGNYEIRQFEVTWSESLAQYLTRFAPLFMGLGMLLILVEFKTPGFGWPGVSGGVLLAIVFFGHYVAGLSGHEPAVFFALGLLLLAVELFFFPGAVLPALLGVSMMLGALLWAMADIWPDQPVSISSDVFVQPAINLSLAMLISVALALLLLRFLPRTWFWDRLVLSAAIGANSQGSATASAPSAAGVAAVDPLVGRTAVTVTAMFPSGEVEIDGQRYQARHDLGFVPAGTPVVVTGRTDFGLLVQRPSS
jgi:membrane-bound serine protease (ClpP class)